MTQAADTSTGYETFDIERDGAVFIASVNNPPMNTINLQMAQDLDRLIDEVSNDPEVRVVLFTSATEGLFIAGADLSMLFELDEETIAKFERYGAIFDRLATLPQPTICAMPGTTLGGGFEFALACDFRFIATGFGEVGCPEVRLGVLPGAGGTQRLPRLVGPAVATEMLLKGMRYTPDKALELGLVHKVIEADKLQEEARAYAQSLAKQAPLAVQRIKRLIRAAFETPGEEGLRLEKELFREVLLSQDAKEGINAFFEGRKPSFSGS